ncbi:MAG: lysine 2,3-aminomutase [Bacteroidales bacterium]
MKFITYNTKNLRQIEYLKNLPEEKIREIEIVAQVLPFKTNNYVTDYLINWDQYETDPVFILNFPNRDMLRQDQYEQVKNAMDKNIPENELQRIVNRIRLQLNPHPAEQMTNIPHLNGEPLDGCQHKYQDIILFFPSQGQTCHAHCTFCFRWPQFVKDLDLQFSMKEIEEVTTYIKQNEQIHEILFTGGDPMVMSPGTISRYIDEIFDADIPHLDTIRFGTKSLTYWPFTFIPEFSDEAEDMLNLFRRIVDGGKHLAFMAHFNHPNEMDNSAVQEAIWNIRQTGAEIRTQAPVLRNINDTPEIWREMWTKQVNLGLVPYYMFIERETGPYEYFGIPLARVFEIYQKAVKYTASLSKTATAPVMSAAKGKVQIMGVVENPLDQENYFMLQYVRHRDASKTYKPFFARYDEEATWFDQLEVVEPVLREA